MRGLRGRLLRMDGTVSRRTVVALVAAGLAVGATGAPRLARGSLPALFGQHTRGQALAVAEERGPDGVASGYDRVTVGFTAGGGVRVHVERRLSRNRVKGVEKGEELPVAYFAGSPLEAQVLDLRADWVGGLGPVILGAVLLFVAFVGRPRGGDAPAAPAGAPGPGRKRRRR